MPRCGGGLYCAVVRFAAAVILTLAVAGCVEQTLSITSQPPGAEVWLNGQLAGSTPMTRELEAYGNYDVVVRRDGHDTIKTSRHIKTPWYMLPPLDLLMEVQPFRIADHRTLDFALVPTTQQAADPEAMLRRANEMRPMLRSSATTRSAGR